MFNTTSFTAFLEAHIARPEYLQPFTAEVAADGAPLAVTEVDNSALLFMVPGSRAVGGCTCDEPCPNTATQVEIARLHGAIKLANVRPLTPAAETVGRWSVVEAAQQLGLSSDDTWRLLEAQRDLVRSVLMTACEEGAGTWALASPMPSPRSSCALPPALDHESTWSGGGRSDAITAVALGPLAKCAAPLPSRTEEAAERVLYDALAIIFSSQTVVPTELQRCADTCLGHSAGSHCRRLLATSLCRPERLLVGSMGGLVGTSSLPGLARWGASGSRSARHVRRRSSWSALDGRSDGAAAAPRRPYTPLGTSHSRGSCLCHESFDALAFLCTAALNSCFEAGQEADLPSAHALLRGGAWNFYVMHGDGRREFLAERLRGARGAGSLALWQLAFREALRTARQSGSIGAGAGGISDKIDDANKHDPSEAHKGNCSEVVFEQAGSLVYEMLGLGVGVDQVCVRSAGINLRYYAVHVSPCSSYLCPRSPRRAPL